YRDQEDVYNSSNCHKCVVNEETSDHLAVCPADKETWKRLEEEIAGKVWNSIPSDSQRKVDWHQLLEILTSKNTPEDQRRTLLTRGIINLDVRRKLEHLDLENKPRTTIRNEDSMNQPSLKEVEMETRKTEWEDCLRIVCDEVKKWIKD
ncbi:25204_t:CDS:2, partial [Gigaspora margarita]